jgi:hypothetical protein
MLENTEGVMKKDNPEKLATLGTQDTGQISLDCPFVLPLRYSLTCICPVSCVPYVASFSGLSFCITPSVLSNMYLSCVICTLNTKGQLRETGNIGYTRHRTNTC